MLRIEVLFLLSFVGCYTDAVNTSPDTMTVEQYVRLAFSQYDSMIPPVDPRDRPLNVNISLAIQRIVEFTTEELTLDAWMSVTWNEKRIGRHLEMPVGHISIPKSNVWVPDITLYERPRTHWDLEPNVVFFKDHRIVYVPSARLWTDDCVTKEDGTTECSFRLGTWTHDTATINLMSDGILFTDFREHPKYEVVNSMGVRKGQHDACCTETWPYIMYQFSIKNRKEKIV